MPEFHERPDLIPNFVGRERKCNGFAMMSFDATWFTPIVVHGPGGVGKTAFLRQFLASTRMSHTPSWLDLYPFGRPDEAIDSFVERMFADREVRERIVVLDGAESMTDKQVETAVARVFNWKAVRSLVISSRPRVKRPPKIEGMEVDEFIRRNADPIWLHQNEMWEYWRTEVILIQNPKVSEL